MWQIGDAAGRPDWRVLDTPLDCTLSAVVSTVDGPYAVGGTGVVAANRGKGWEVVVDDTPPTDRTQHRAVDVTDDGERLWVAGTDGSMACYDVRDGRTFDFGYPEELAETWDAIAVSGPRGSEKLLAADGSGEVLPFAVDGVDVDWGHLDRVTRETATVSVLGSTPDGVGFVVATDGRAYRTTPDEGWTPVGVVATDASFTGLDAGADERVYVAADDGHLYRYGAAYSRWTPIDVDAEIRSLDVYDAGDGRTQLTVLSDDGRIYERAGADQWEDRPAPTDTRLYGLELGDPDVLVGENGTVVERPRTGTERADATPDGERAAGRERRPDRVDTE